MEEMLIKEKAEWHIEQFHKNSSKIYIFGAGTFGKDYKNILSLFDCFAGFIDNDKKKQTEGYLGSKVYSLEEYMAQGEKGCIIIATNDSYIGDIKQQLLDNGFRMGIDFYLASGFMKEIFPLICFYHYNKLFVELAQISVTERCTLKCIKCAHACYNVPSDVKDMELLEAKISVDSFFKKVDMVGEFTLIGGEPLLYRELCEIVAYVGENYRKKIGNYTITTNGTLIPNEKLLTVCKKYNVMIRISNYSATIQSLIPRYEQLCRVLEDAEVDYVLGGADRKWYDYGFGCYDRGKEADLRTVFSVCRTPCREIRGNKFYYCVMARSVSDNLGMNIGKDDYINLDVCDKEQLFLFQMGISRKGYLDMCRYCRGAQAVNHLIQAAVQKGSKEVNDTSICNYTSI